MKDILYEPICERIKQYLEESVDLTAKDKKSVAKVIPAIYDILTDLEPSETVAEQLGITKEEIAELKGEEGESLEDIEKREYYNNVLAPQIASLNRR